MIYTEEELLRAGLKTEQARLLRQQHAHLRNEGQSTQLSTLALRSRFVSEDELIANDASAEAGTVALKKMSTLLPLEWCKRWSCLPTDYSRGVLTLSCSQPLAPAQLDRIREMIPVEVREVRLQPISRQDLVHSFTTLEQSGSAIGLISMLCKHGLEAGLLRRLVYALLHEALDLRASDIHLSKKTDPDAWIAYRIDSMMRQVHLLPQLLMQSLVARIKIEAGMDASNSRTAQDGRIAADYQGRVVDFRISSQPLVDGESIVLRALDSAQLPGLRSLFPNQPKMIGLVRGLIGSNTKSGGLVLITGATGSGKSTTQYTVACGFPRDEVNLITVEDPVEYLLPFAKQIQLQALIKQKAIELERSILRQDPDVLVFGEIRDADSARAALAFAESGHLVISTLHANSVLQVTERFLSIIDQSHREDAKFLLAHYLKVIVHQKLVRRLCICAQVVTGSEYELVKEQASRLTGGLIQLKAGVKHKVGCPNCVGGYLGRASAHETLAVPHDEHMRGRFVQAMNADRLELPADLHAENGVDFISRLETLQILLDNGVVDWPTACKTLGLQEDVGHG